MYIFVVIIVFNFLLQKFSRELVSMLNGTTEIPVICTPSALVLKDFVLVKLYSCNQSLMHLAPLPTICVEVSCTEQSFSISAHVERLENSVPASKIDVNVPLIVTVMTQ